MNTRPSHAVAAIALPPKPAAQPCGDAERVFERLRGLASAARALDPSLGTVLRFVQRDQTDRLGSSFDVLITHDVYGALPFGVVQDKKAVGLWDAVSASLGESFAAAERARMEREPTYLLPRSTDAAVYAANRVGLYARDGGNTDVVVTSGPLPVEPLDFMRYGDLTRNVLLAPKTTTEKAQSAADHDRPAVPNYVRDYGLSAVQSMREKLQRIRAILSRPFDETSPAHRQEVAVAIRSLQPPRPGMQSFEAEQDHGWVGYALASDSPGWASFLIRKAGADPAASYEGFRPTEMAIAANSARDLHAILQGPAPGRGLSANALLSGFPRLRSGAVQKNLEGLDDVFVPPLVYACAIGASDAADTLLRHGADPLQATNKGVTPLMVCAMMDNESMARQMLAKGADPLAVDRHGRTAMDYVGPGKARTAMRDLLSAAAAQAAARSQVPPDLVTVADAVRANPSPARPDSSQPLAPHPIPSIWSRPSAR